MQEVGNLRTSCHSKVHHPSISLYKTFPRCNQAYRLSHSRMAIIDSIRFRASKANALRKGVKTPMGTHSFRISHATSRTRIPTLSKQPHQIPRSKSTCKTKNMHTELTQSPLLGQKTCKSQGIQTRKPTRPLATPNKCTEIWH